MDPRPWLDRAKAAGAVVVCQVQTVEAARVAAAAGADVLVAQGNEAGGHTGEANLLPFLIRLVEEYPDLPIVAAGGIASGRSLAAGAEGACMGTGFLATRQAVSVSDGVKELIVQSSAEDTVHTRVFDIVARATSTIAPWPRGIAARVYNNAFARQWTGRENELSDRLDEIVPAYSEARARKDLSTVVSYFGESASFINAIRDVADVLSGICRDAQNLLSERAARLVE